MERLYWLWVSLSVLILGAFNGLRHYALAATPVARRHVPERVRARLAVLVPFSSFLPGGFARAFNAPRFLPGGFARAFNKAFQRAFITAIA
ncbi:hypothetical protein GGTG_01106 [Gaeumannomyces tritici R3-111a-1]|uniref:Uncharacterized protein n=1 Tax=Gaeumannomyces tritici (strain R3-111a-1) TaxID=644352 RepID=J3NIM8_GAET3|nr:hypothetical protein GGTG_01106 [Gaeumannomyces tritici R3-111a-1]EJT81121.1 hypothetical protein GGTG_01106 [Gaeumannomyces tritici R3-111a-1]